MGWSKTTVVESRFEFVQQALRGEFTMSQLCQAYGISRKTGYKWLNRYREVGLEGLKDRSRAPRKCPHATDAKTVAMVTAMRKAHPSWGAGKIKARLEKKHPGRSFPARSTIHDILVREGWVKPRRSTKRNHGASSPPRFDAQLPNGLWCADFKGEFRTRDGHYCFPLTVSDWASRQLLACQGLASTKVVTAREVFEQVFDTYGVPDAILTDNGVPFCHPNALCRLSQLSVWWMKLGIELLRIQPGRPQQNGRHERMHRTLKAEATRPPGADMQDQQRRFDAFVETYNTIRPHEALGQTTPSEHYAASKRRPEQRSTQYPGHFEVRKISSSGSIRWAGDKVFVTHALAGEYVGLEEVDEGHWQLYFQDFLLGRLNVGQRRVDAIGPTPVRAAEKVLPMLPD